MNKSILLTVSLVFSLACHGALAGGPNVVVSGSTLFPPLTDADVTLRVGAEQYAATTNAQGDYSLEIPTPGTDDLISLEIQGTGAQSHYRYARLVGQWSDLEHGATVVDLGPTSPLSTVLYVLVEARSGGSLPIVFSNIEPLSRTLGTGDIDWMMRVLAAIEQDLIGIGVGNDNTLDMLRDPQEILLLIGEVAETVASWDQAHAALRRQFEDPRFYRTRGQLPDSLETISTDLDSRRRTMIDFEGGTPAWLGHRNYGGPISRYLGEVIWADRFTLNPLVGRRWTFVPAEGAEIVYWEHRSGPDADGEFTLFRVIVERLTWRPLNASASFRLADTELGMASYYPEKPWDAPNRFVKKAPYDIALELRHDTLPDNWQGPRAGSIWALPLCVYDFDNWGGPSFMGPFGQDFITLNADGTASARRAQFDLQWSLQGSVLTLVADGMPDVHLSFLGSTSRGDLVAATCRNESGEARAVTARAVPVAPVPGFDELDLPLRFVSGFSLHGYLPRFQISPERPIYMDNWVIDLYPDGTGKAGEVLDPFETSTSPATYSLDWTQLANRRVEIHMEHIDSGADGAQSRSWLPIDVRGDDILFVESLYFGPLGELDDDLEQPGRYNWYRMVEMPSP